MHGVIQFLVLDGKTTKEIHEKISTYFSYKVMRLWVNKFKRGRRRTTSRRSKNWRHPRNHWQDMVLADGRMKVWELAEASIATESSVYEFQVQKGGCYKL